MLTLLNTVEVKISAIHNQDLNDYELDKMNAEIEIAFYKAMNGFVNLISEKYGEQEITFAVTYE